MADKKAAQSNSALGNKVLEILMEFLLGKKIAVRPHQRRVGKEAEHAQIPELGVGICLLPWSEWVKSNPEDLFLSMVRVIISVGSETGDDLQ